MLYTVWFGVELDFNRTAKLSVLTCCLFTLATFYKVPYNKFLVHQFTLKHTGYPLPLEPNQCSISVLPKVTLAVDRAGDQPVNAATLQLVDSPLNHSSYGGPQLQVNGTLIWISNRLTCPLFTAKLDLSHITITCLDNFCFQSSVRCNIYF